MLNLPYIDTCLSLNLSNRYWRLLRCMCNSFAVTETFKLHVINFSIVLSISSSFINDCKIAFLISILLSVSVWSIRMRSEEHTSELQSRGHLVCRLLLE